MSQDSELQFLHNVIQNISDADAGHAALQRLTDLIHIQWGPEAVSIAQVGIKGTIIFCAASGSGAEQTVGMHLEPGVGIVGWVAEHAHPLWVPDVTVEARFSPQIDRHTGFSTRSILAYPMRARGKVRGVLEIINPTPETDVQAMGNLVESIARLAAPIIDTSERHLPGKCPETRYRRLFDLNPNPTVVLSGTGRWLEANQSAQSLLGLLGDKLIETDLAKMGLQRPSFAEFSRQARDNGDTVWEFSSSEQGKIMEAHLLYLPDYEPEGSYLWTAHDITHQINQAQSRQELMQMVVHDLRAPLSSIQNSMELVLSAWRERDVTMPIEQVLSIGLRTARRMEQLISDILDSARLSAEEHDLTITEIKVKTLIDEAVETVTSSIRRRHQTLSIHLDPEISTLNGDVDLLRRVIVNLLSNAVKYSRDGGKLGINISIDQDEMLFSVTDNGYGIAPSLQNHIFELFARGESHDTKGTGIGLAFCKLAVEAHGGRIWLQSEIEQGSCFVFAIPQRLPLSITHQREVEP